MTIPLFVLLIVYLALAAAVAVLGALKTVALYAYGGSFSAFLATAVFWGGYAIVVMASWSVLSGVDWTTPLIDLSTFFNAPL